MSWGSTVVVVKNKMLAAGAKNVFNRRRWIVEEPKWRKTFSETQPLPSQDGSTSAKVRCQGWFIRRRRVDYEEESCNARFSGENTWRLEGFRTFVDSDDDANNAEVEWQNLCDSICAKLRVNTDLDQAADVFHAYPASIHLIEERMIFGVLCHWAEIHLRVREFYTQAT